MFDYAKDHSHDDNIVTYFQENGDNRHGDQEKEELFDVPGAPENPLIQSHHLHRFTHAGLLLYNQFLRGKENAKGVS